MKVTILTISIFQCGHIELGSLDDALYRKYVPPSYSNQISSSFKAMKKNITTLLDLSFKPNKSIIHLGPVFNNNDWIVLPDCKVFRKSNTDIDVAEQ